MVTDNNSAMGDYLRRQKRMEDLFKPPWWAEARQPSWMKAFDSPHVALAPKSPLENVLNSSKHTIVGMSGVSSLVKELTSEPGRGMTAAMGITEMNRSIVQTVLGSPGVHNSAVWAIKSVFSDVAGSQRGMFGHLTEFIPKLAPSALESFDPVKAEGWFRRGAEALEDYPPQAQRDEISPDFDEIEPEALRRTASALHEELEELRKQLDTWGTADEDFSDLDTLYEPVATKIASMDGPTAPAEPWTRADKIALATFIVTAFGVLVTIVNMLLPPGDGVMQQEQNSDDTPRIEAPDIKTDSDETPSGDASTAKIDVEDDEPKRNE